MVTKNFKLYKIVLRLNKNIIVDKVSNSPIHKINENKLIKMYRKVIEIKRYTPSERKKIKKLKQGY